MYEHTLKIHKYEGGNEFIDHLLGDETWWVVNGPNGRIPIEAGTEEEAKKIYASRPKRDYSTVHGEVHEE